MTGDPDREILASEDEGRECILLAAETKWGFKSTCACSGTVCALFNDGPPEFIPRTNDRLRFRYKAQLAETSGMDLMEKYLWYIGFPSTPKIHW